MEKWQFSGKPLYYEEKVKKTIFPQNFVYVLSATTTRHIVRFIDFISIFSQPIVSQTSPHMFSTFPQVMLRDTQGEPGLPVSAPEAIRF